MPRSTLGKTFEVRLANPAGCRRSITSGSRQISQFALRPGMRRHLGTRDLRYIPVQIDAQQTHAVYIRPLYSDAMLGKSNARANARLLNADFQSGRSSTGQQPRMYRCLEDQRAGRWKKAST